MPDDNPPLSPVGDISPQGGETSGTPEPVPEAVAEPEPVPEVVAEPEPVAEIVTETEASYVHALEAVYTEDNGDTHKIRNLPHVSEIPQVDSIPQIVEKPFTLDDLFPPGEDV